MKKIELNNFQIDVLKHTIKAQYIILNDLLSLCHEDDKSRSLFLYDIDVLKEIENKLN